MTIPTEHQERQNAAYLLVKECLDDLATEAKRPAYAKDTFQIVLDAFQRYARAVGWERDLADQSEL